MECQKVQEFSCQKFSFLKVQLSKVQLSKVQLSNVQLFNVQISSNLFPTLPFSNQHLCYKFSPGLFECVNFPPTFQRSKIDSREREGLKILFQSCFLDAVLPTKKVKRSKRSFSSRFLAPIKTLAWASKVTKTPSRGPPAGLIR